MLGLMITLFQARIERIEQLENELNLSESEVSKFCDLYETEKEKLLDVESDLKDCKVIRTSVT
jgi:kinesin family protein 11